MSTIASVVVPVNCPKSRNKTVSLSGHSVKRSWILIDAADAVVGRLASFIAARLRGKHRPDYTPHVDCGDCVVVINADMISFTGSKETDKKYYRHTGYPGGIKSKTPKMIRSSKKPGDILKYAVSRMISKGPLANKRIKNLYIYSGDTNPHVAQCCKVIDFVSIMRKNSVIDNVINES